MSFLCGLGVCESPQAKSGAEQDLMEGPAVCQQELLSLHGRALVPGLILLGDTSRFFRKNRNASYIFSVSVEDCHPLT